MRGGGRGSIRQPTTPTAPAIDRRRVPLVACPPVFLYRVAVPSRRCPSRCDIVPTTPRLYNACGTTGTFNDTIANLEQMGALIAPDSFLMRLGGALGIPTVALMSRVPARLRCSQYPSITPLEPDFPCASFMMTTQERCPEGFDDCHALRSSSMRPACVLRTLENILVPATTPTGQFSARRGVGQPTTSRQLQGDSLGLR